MKSFRELLESTLSWRAGGFPYFIDTNNKVLVCLFVSNDPSYGGSFPQISKGHPDKGETSKQASAREVHEETNIPLSDLLKDTKKISTRKFSGQVANYMMHCWSFKLSKQYPIVKTEEGQGIWLELNDALDKIRKDQKIFLQDFQNSLNK